ncbi:MAG TPA: 4-aminobutyrate--2-oxoglutarate transaminase [Anaeromyxobacteraceae bacterium]|nr:4-aminobutyrate--2-oxoglutarate transaminase [Anaeromyxobacteraceae bacterium]
MASRQAEYQALREQHVPRGAFHATPAFVKEAHGAVMVDLDGRELIDFAGGIGVMNVGHSHPKVIAAIKDQVEKYVHTCFHIAMYEPYVDLAAKLNQLTPGAFHKKTLFANSGAEAVENAIKIARYATKRPAVIALQSAFHGRTLLTMSLTSKVKPYKLGFGPFAPEVYRMPNAYCYRCPFGLKYPSCNVACADHLEEFFVGNVAPEQVAALIAEPIQGEGGFVTPPPEYFAKLQAICKKHGIVLVIDEVQSAMGRAGKLFAIEHWGIEPDILLTAKSLAGGLPLAAVTGKAELMDAPHVGGLGGTFAGNPVACRAALAVLEVLLADGLLTRAEQLGAMIRQRFDALQTKHELIGDVRGKGPMLAIELVKDRAKKTPAADETKKLVQRCYEKGLVFIACGNFGNVIRTLMPLVITDAQLDRGFEILDEALGEVAAGR